MHGGYDKKLPKDLNWAGRIVKPWLWVLDVRHFRRQNRIEPADERDPGGDGAGALPKLVRGF